VLLDDIG
jgi:EAL domain-containing protein (putative c-di-GMP-specific phosphodiesterase class I)